MDDLRLAKICAWMRDDYPLKDIEGFEPLGGIIEHLGTDTQVGMGLLDGAYPLIVFRNTELKLRDILTDVQFRKRRTPYANMHDSEVRIHGGFIEAYHSVRLEIYRRLAGSENYVVMTGHSLGGALAQICAVDMNYLYGYFVECVTFGAPRVGNVAFKQSLEERVRLRRYENGNDLVPMLPWEHFWYAHAGDICRVGEQGFPWVSVQDHLLRNYIKEIEQVHNELGV